MEIGINASCAGDDVINDTLTTIKSVGIRNVMISQKGKEFEEYVINAKMLGLDIPFVHLEHRDIANDLWLDPKRAQDYIIMMIDGLEVCYRHGIKVAVMHATNGDVKTNPPKVGQNGIKNMQTILDAARLCGVRIALENTDQNFEHFTYLMDNIPDLGFCYDCGHHYLYTPNEDLVGRYGNRMIAVHIHDNLRNWGGVREGFSRDIHVLPLSGTIDFAKVVADITRAKYKGVWVIECYQSAIWANIKLYSKATLAEFLREAMARFEKLKRMVKVTKAR